MTSVSKDHYVFSFDREAKAVLTVESGSEIVFHTHDCYRGQLLKDSVGEIHPLEGINPATGPIAIQGAEPGDTLRVTILSIELENVGTMYIRPGAGVLKKYVAHPEVKKLQIDDNRIHFERVGSFPIRPMIGVIGISPVEGSIHSLVPGNHGGNMDTKEITVGAIVYLPVNVPGANLAIGDLHAAMGDGEVAICGVEIGGTVRVQVELMKGVSFPNPVLEDRTHFYVIASATTLDEACEEATEHMFLFLQERLPHVSANDIICVMGIAGDLRISQLVNPLRTAKFLFPKGLYDIQFC